MKKPHLLILVLAIAPAYFVYFYLQGRRTPAGVSAAQQQPPKSARPMSTSRASEAQLDPQQMEEMRANLMAILKSRHKEELLRNLTDKEYEARLAKLCEPVLRALKKGQYPFSDLPELEQIDPRSLDIYDWEHTQLKLIVAETVLQLRLLIDAKDPMAIQYGWPRTSNGRNIITSIQAAARNYKDALEHWDELKAAYQEHSPIYMGVTIKDGINGAQHETDAAIRSYEAMR